MGMFDNKPVVSSQTQTSQPWAPAQDSLKDILSKAGAIGADGSTFNPSFSADTTTGLARLGQLGTQPSAGAAAMQPVVNQSVAGYGVGQKTLQDTARGSYIDGNQYIDQVLKNANQHTADAVNAQFNASGRYGSGAHTTALTKQIGEQNTAALSTQYNQERGNQLAAAGQLGQFGMTGAGMAPQIDAAKAHQIGYQIAAGQGQDANANATRLAPFTALQARAGLTNPIAVMGSTSSGSGTQEQESNPMTTALGLGMSALSFLSDERVKDDIREVGETHDGQKIYSYRYKGDPRTQLGLLAQEVEEVAPEAVGNVGGVKTVNYKVATKDAERGKVKRSGGLGLLVD